MENKVLFAGIEGLKKLDGSFEIQPPQDHPLSVQQTEYLLIPDKVKTVPFAKLEWGTIGLDALISNPPKLVQFSGKDDVPLLVKALNEHPEWQQLHGDSINFFLDTAAAVDGTFEEKFKAGEEAIFKYLRENHITLSDRASDNKQFAELRIEQLPGKEFVTTANNGSPGSLPRGQRSNIIT